MEKHTVFIYGLTYFQTTTSSIRYNAFLDKFGEEGNLIVVGVKDDAFTQKPLLPWTN
jgi:hypothetical protein